MKDTIKNYLTQLGYHLDLTALAVIEETNDWYTNQKIKGFHDAEMVNGETYDLERMNFAKTVCSDDANLIEAVEITAQKNKKQNKEINAILNNNKFIKRFREQVEEMSANGTVGAYISLENAEIYQDGTIKNGKISINYCNALNIIPLTVVKKEIIECAFVSSVYKDTEQLEMIVMFNLIDGKYQAKTVYLDSNGNEKEIQTVQLAEVKPFAIMRTAQVNNLKMKGYGYPKLWSAIPNLKIIDLGFTMLKRDLEKADKLILLNERLASKDKNGNKIPPSKAMRKIFIQFGQDKLPEEKSLYQEYNPTIRIGEFTQTFELALGMLSMSFGYGTKKYKFENGQIMTASEYVGDRQDMLQAINKQRAESTDYITDIVKAIRWFSNTFNGTSYADDEITVDYDDSYIEDKNAIIEALRNDALSFEIDTLKVWYLCKRYNITEEEAKALLNEAPPKTDGTQLEE